MNLIFNVNFQFGMHYGFVRHTNGGHTERRSSLYICAYIQRINNEQRCNCKQNDVKYINNITENYNTIYEKDVIICVSLPIREKRLLNFMFFYTQY